MKRKSLSRRDFLRLSTTAAVGAVAAACAPKTIEVEKVVEKEVTKIVEKAVEVEPTVIRFHGRMGTQGDHFDHFAKIFNDDHFPDVYVKTENFPGADYFAKVNTMIAGGTIGDAMWISSIEGFYRMAATGTFIPMDDLISGANYDLGQFYEVAVEAAKHKGQIYGLPWCTHPGRVGLYYYKPTFDAAGVDYPTYEWTYDDLLEAAKAISKPDQNVFGFFPTSAYFGLLVYQRAWGGDMINEDGTKCPINSPESVAALQYVSDLFHVHNVAPQPAQIEVGTYQMVAAGKIAMYQSGFWGGSVRDYVDRDTWGTVPMPYGPAGVRGSMYEFDPVCITYTSEHPMETFEYLTYLCTYEAGMDMYQVRVTAPGARPDVWRSEEMLADPHFTVYSTVMDEILPLVLPANFRETEYFKTIGELLSVVWIGEKELAEVVDSVQAEAQAILDKPSLEA